MSKIMKSLATLFASQEENAPAAPFDRQAALSAQDDNGANAPADEPAPEEDPATDEDPTEGVAPEPEPTPAPAAAEPTPAANTVNLALADYEKLISLASDAKDARAESKALKVKAEQWDNYQAALAGGKPVGDTAGGKPAAETPTSEVAQLRAKHGALMDDIAD